MMPILYVIAATLLSISLLIGLPQGVNLVQSKVEARNIPSNKVITQGEFQSSVEIIKPIPPIARLKKTITPANNMLILRKL